MNKPLSRKGFTIVEIVIVIAVIAILATVIIFSVVGIVENSKQKAAMQSAKSLYTDYMRDFDYTSGETPKEDGYILVDGYYVIFVDGNVVNCFKEDKFIADTADKIQ